MYTFCISLRSFLHLYFDENLIMSEITYFDPDELKGNLYCSINTQGKLYFSMYAKRFIGLDKFSSVRIGRKEDYNILFLEFHEDQVGHAFKIHKSGEKRYVDIKVLFDKISSIYFDLNLKPKYKLTKARGEKENMFQLTYIPLKDKEPEKEPNHLGE